MPHHKKQIAVVGDYVTDVVSPAESKHPLHSGKETITVGGASEHCMATGPGGVVYLQQLFELLFETHLQSVLDAGQDPKLKLAAIQRGAALYQHTENQVKPEHVTAQCMYANHWSVAKRPKDLSSSSPSTYRVIEKLGTIKIENKPIEQPSLPDAKLFSPTGPELLIIADHARDIRTDSQWLDSHNHWLTQPSDEEGTPRRIILLGNSLPSIVLQRPQKEPLWDVLYSSDAHLKSTLVVTSIDRLRQEGAKISKRISWDCTLMDFQHELEAFEPLKQLARVGHLIVRMGVVGMLHCYWSKEGKREIRFVYDPVQYGAFRERTQQGDSFAIRSTTPACIAFHLFLRHTRHETENMPWHACEPNEAIQRGLRDAISITQNLYLDGFGSELKNVHDYVSDLNERKSALRKSLSKSHTTYRDQKELDKRAKAIAEGRVVKAEWFTHVLCPPIKTPLPNPHLGNTPWTIMRDTLRAHIKDDELQLECLEQEERGLAGDDPVSSVMSKLKHLEELRRLRMARAIVFLGVDAALNNKAPSEAATRRQDERRESYLDRMLKLEQKYDRLFRDRTVGEIRQQDIVHLVVPEWTEDAFPLLAPVSKFGPLVILGRTDTENYSSIRNLLSAHLTRQQSKPLSLSVFGEPGSGKSFGIKAIAKAIAGDHIETYVCNLSQLKEREDLNREFFNVSQIHLKGKTPLVFFDEFDSQISGGPKLGWLKYFLEPMQDGRFRHPDGVVELKNSIFVFAGGTCKNYDEFSSKQDDKDCKDVKLIDFISRLHGYFDVPGVNASAKSAKRIPYIRRALILRSLLEEDRELLDDLGRAQIDKNIADAFLRVTKYHHGARSVGAVFGMCMRWSRRIEKVSLPTTQQLNLHTDGPEFIKLVTNSKELDPLKVPDSPDEVTSGHSN